MGVKVFDSLGFEYACMPQAVIPAGREEGLHKPGLYLLVREDTPYVLLFQGFQIEHIS